MRPTASRYRVADNVNLPLRIIPAVQEEGRARVSINLKVSADFSYKLFGSNIVVKVRTERYDGAVGCAVLVAGLLVIVMGIDGVGPLHQNAAPYPMPRL